jgi:hypothetical protein
MSENVVEKLENICLRKNSKLGKLKHKICEKSSERNKGRNKGRLKKIEVHRSLARTQNERGSVL